MSRWQLNSDKLDEAKRTISTVLEIDPGSIAGELILGEVLLVQNEFEAAETQFQAAILESPNNYNARNPNVLYYLAEALASNDRSEEAGKVLDVMLQSPQLFRGRDEAVLLKATLAE